MNKSILDIFYNVLIKETVVGRVDCFFKYNMRFDTIIREDNIEVLGDSSNSNLLIPTLVIKNKNEFNELLVRYIELALKFYDDSCFVEEIKNCHYFDNELGISKEKLIMTLLWSNATEEDFHNPCDFLRKRINFFELNELSKYMEEKFVGYSEMLGYDFYVKIEKNGLENETPYSLRCYLAKESGSKIYEFPSIYFGMSNNNLYVYAIQNKRDKLINESYSKKIDRLLYKVNDGLDVKNDNFDNFGIGNLKDITPSFLVSANMLMGMIKDFGINKVIVPSILVSRWNAKMIVLDNKKKYFMDKGMKDKEVFDFVDRFIDEQNYIQSNLTEKFLRVFRRLVYHHSSITVRSFPFELGNNLELSILDGDNICNNRLLDEIYNFNYYNGIKKNIR